MPTALIVFDLDGTLVDSERDLADSANELLAGYGAPPLAIEDVAAMVGDGARQLVRRALAAADVRTDLDEALERFLAIYGGRLFVHTRPYAGIPEAIAALSDQAALAVLTNKPQRLSERLLEGFGMAAWFGWVLGGDSVFPRKPDPSGLIHLAGQAGAPLDRTMMVGDSVVDVETARAAGTSICIARYGFGQNRRPIPLVGDELVAERPESLVELLGRFAASP
jgi:phosphoglycolate phosphatase